MDYFWLLLFAHVLGATIWTGGHLVLAILILPRALNARDPAILLDFEQGFERIGMPALFVQVATGLWMAWQLSPGLSSWLSFNDPVTSAIAAKLVLLLATAGLALNARFRVITTLSVESLPLMGWHIRAVTLLSVLFVATGVFIRTGGF